MDYLAEFEVIEDEGNAATLYFHINPLHVQNGWNSSPWGHLSRERECVGNVDVCSGQNSTASNGGHFESKDDLDSPFPKVYRQEMDGVRMSL